MKIIKFLKKFATIDPIPPLKIEDIGSLKFYQIFQKFQIRMLITFYKNLQLNFLSLLDPIFIANHLSQLTRLK